MKLIYKAEFGRLPVYLCEMFVYVSTTQPYNLRDNSKFRLPQSMSSFGQNTIMFKGIKIYNEMKAQYQMTENIIELKKN